MPEAELETDERAPEADLALLEAAAHQAGELALGYFGQGLETWFKGNKSPVSEADIAVDRFLANRLLSERPDYGWLSEETADDRSRLNCRRVFIVDPIDGTRAFLSGGEEWTISVAVVEGGRPVAGAVYCPIRNEMFTAHAGGGAYLNGNAIQVSSRRDVSGATLTGPHSIVSNTDVLAAGFQKTEILRSLAYRLVVVAAGRIDVGTARGGPSDWDLAAADLVVQESGGALIDVDGRVLTYNRPRTGHPALIAASTGLIGPVRAVLGDILR